MGDDTTGTTTDDTTGTTTDDTTGTTTDDTATTGTNGPTGGSDDGSGSGEATTTPTTGTTGSGTTPGAGSAAGAALAARLHLPLGDLLSGSLDDQLIAMEALTKAITSADPVTESDRYGASFLGQAALRTHVMTENLSGVKLDWMGLEQEAGTWDVSGRFRTYASYVATAYGTSATNARRMVNLAKGLRNHLPGTRARLRAGRIGVDQAQILLKVTSTDAGINALQNPSIPTDPNTDSTGTSAGADGTDADGGAGGATAPGTETSGTDATADAATDTDATDGSGTSADTATDGGADGTADGADPAGSATGGADRVPTVEELLLENAAIRTPEELRQLVEHFLMMADPDATDKAFRDAAGREFLNIDRTMDGYHVAGFLTIEHGQYIRTALEAMMGVPAAGEERTLSQRRAQALADLTRVALDEGKVGKSNSVRPHLGVLISTPEFLDLINTAKANTDTAAAATGTAATATGTAAGATTSTGTAPGTGVATGTGTGAGYAPIGSAGPAATGSGAAPAPVCTTGPVATGPVATGIVADSALSATPTDVDPAPARPRTGAPIIDPLPDLATLTPDTPGAAAAPPTASPAPSTNGAALPTEASTGSNGAALPTGASTGPNGAALPTGASTGADGAAPPSSSLLLPGTTPVDPVDLLDRDWARLLAAGPARFVDNTGPVPRAVLEKLINCTGEIYRIILGPDNEIINHGRAHRLFTTQQRRALVARDQHCVAPNCTAPPEWCESHHGTRHWADGGATNLEDAALLCSHDHDWVHNHHITMTRIDGVWHFYKPDGTEILPTPGPWD